jgi:hypothetical protein
MDEIVKSATGMTAPEMEQTQQETDEIMNLLEEQNNEDDTFKPGDGIQLGRVGAHLVPAAEQDGSSDGQLGSAKNKTEGEQPMQIQGRDRLVSEDIFAEIDEMVLDQRPERQE